MTQFARPFAFALLLGLTAGCGEATNEKPVFPVHGKLTFGGKPMAKAVISYYSTNEADRNVPSHATADADGVYHMQTYRQNDGVPAGNYVVTIFWPGKPSLKAKADPVENPEDVAVTDQLGGKYSRAASTPARATVKAEPDNVIDFNLTP